MMTRRRGVILATVLFVLLLLGLLVAAFSFRINADLASMQAVAVRRQSRLAAEAGVEFVKLLLRTSRYDMDRWYHNPDELNRVIFWAFDTDPSVWGTTKEFPDDRMAYRFSIVADDPTDDERFIRFGITDESSKLNLNEATEDQLLILVQAATVDDQEVDPQGIVDAILNWRDQDSNPRGERGDSEGEYYRRLDRPYRIRNGPFDTVEELLLVKGVTARILYGEDYDRNGLLTPNEDDGDDNFPPDNADSVLNRGLYPYLTVLSKENNVSNENQPRIYLLGDEETVRGQLSDVFPDDPDVVDFVISSARSGGGNNATPPSDGGDTPSTEGNPTTNGGEGSGANPQGGPAGQDSEDNQSTAPGSTGNGRNAGQSKLGPQLQVRDGGLQTQDGTTESGAGGEGQNEGDTSGADEDQAPDGSSGQGPTGQEDTGADGTAEQETNGAADASEPIPTPAMLMRPQVIDGNSVPSPITPEQLAVLMDRTTMIAPNQQDIVGLINVNTAPALVLRCLKDLTREQIASILEVRDSLSGDQKATIAWLFNENVLDLDTFERVASRITARGQQFVIESMGFADHVGTVVRLQVVVDMMGPVAQTVYYRDLTELGGAFPIREKDKEDIRGR